MDVLSNPSQLKKLVKYPSKLPLLGSLSSVLPSYYEEVSHTSIVLNFILWSFFKAFFKGTFFKLFGKM
jgi:hypothetical protein